MADLLIPQKDTSGTREAEIKAMAKNYSYNVDTGIPLVQAESDLDKTSPEWKLQIFRVLLKIRSNLDAVIFTTGFKFEKQIIRRDPRTLIGMLKKGDNPVDYYAPDLGPIIPSGRPTSIEDYSTKIFVKDSVPSIAKRFDTDEQFAYTFLAGPNPNQIKRLTSPMANFPISNSHLQSLPQFASDDLKTAMAEGRIYIVDHTGMSVLRNGKHPQGPKYTYAPLAAFAVPRNAGTKGKLYPFAIQCGPTPEGREIYTPADGFTWKIARNCVLAAHNNHHEVVTHLGLTHLLIDPIVIATRCNLHVNHPVHFLLNPHMVGTVAINVGARDTLIKPGASVDRLVGSDITDNHKLLASERLNYSFRDNYLPTRLTRLQTDDTRIIGNYPYRDDGLLIWKAISDWVSDYVELFYKSDAEVRADRELQAWAQEINQVGKVKDFGSAGGLIGRDDLIGVLTMIIWTAGPQHAAVNFSQGTDMTFLPANPLAGYTPEPKGRGHTQQDWLDNFPPLDVAIHTNVELTLLSGVNYTQLGLYGTDPVKHPYVAAKELKFHADLAKAEIIITDRNLKRVDYSHLKPSRIPASINI